MGMHHRQTDLKIGREGISQGRAAYSIRPEDVKVTSRCLGSGASGSVFEAIHIPTGERRAIKIIKSADRTKRKQILQECIAILRMTSKENPEQKNLETHRNLLHYYGGFVDDKTESVKLCMEFMDRGSLATLLKEIKILPKNVIACITKQIVDGLGYVHAMGTLHRDVKPENILINSDGQVKLTDFGVAKTCDTTKVVASTYVGTSIYMSPERITGSSYSTSCDIWSIGLVVIQMATGRHPYANLKSYPELFQWIIATPGLPPFDKSEIDPEILDFVNLCVAKDPADRSTAEHLMQTELLKQAKNCSFLKKWLKETT
eukprot:GHVL01007355.1.p1 GENE.GHVL01007355.1~~GHVL01007355.1.p1  ORF type:complete len:317 (-),score=41.92 GHVL01007355.1:350-1300(-)